MQYPDALFRSLYLEDTHFGVRAAREIALLCRPRFSFHHQHVQSKVRMLGQFSFPQFLQAENNPHSAATLVDRC